MTLQKYSIFSSDKENAILCQIEAQVGIQRAVFIATTINTKK